MEIKKFVHEEDSPAKKRAILILLDMLDEIRVRMKTAKCSAFQALTTSAVDLANTIKHPQKQQKR